MTLRLVLIGGSLAAGTFAACPRPPPPSPESAAQAPAPLIRVPPGCERDLSGPYVHAWDPSFRYLAVEDAGVLSLTVERLEEDGGLALLPADGGAWVVLWRTPGGFVGMTFGTGYTPAGHACPVAFPTEVIRCIDAGLAIRSTTTAEVNEECQNPRRSRPLGMIEHHLLRPGAIWPQADSGAGPTDAGPVP